MRKATHDVRIGHRSPSWKDTADQEDDNHVDAVNILTSHSPLPVPYNPLALLAWYGGMSTCFHLMVPERTGCCNLSGFQLSGGSRLKDASQNPHLYGE